MFHDPEFREFEKTARRVMFLNTVVGLVFWLALIAGAAWILSAFGAF